MATKINNIIIRMYKLGTGDCFVLKFFYGKTETFNMMIDCGSYAGDSIKYSDFVKEIGVFVNYHINLLVITHEHSDHIIGFAKGIDEFNKFKIDNVWVAWTEDPTNELAKSLKKKYNKDKQALASAIIKMKNIINNPDNKQDYDDEYKGSIALDGKIGFLNNLTESLGLYYDSDEIELAASGGSDSQMKKAMNFILKDICKKTGETPFYCYPGKNVPKLKGLDGIRFYILGPPEDEALLKKNEIKGDVYDRKINLQDYFSFITALTEKDRKSSIVKPFQNSFRLEDNEKETYINKYLKGKDNSWRNVDSDWLNNAGNLAIRIEKLINNTSLVIAIEFEDSGKVLLFPGDAQSGNWKSWHDEKLRWEINEKNTTKYVTAKDLLKRTVFYKVGHHLSHNGTASIDGLDLIESDELVAFASLDYKNISSIWKKTMPAPGLMKELIKKTNGRIFRIDNGLIENNDAKRERDKMSKNEISKFNKSFEITPYYIEYVIHG